MELLSIVVTLRPERAARLENNQGRALHAWWLNRARQRDPGLAQRWHQDSALRPFTLSGLWTGREPSWGPLALDPARPVRFRLTTLDRETAELARSALLAFPPAAVRLGSTALAVEEVTADPARHPWAGQSGYEALVSQVLMRGDQLPAALTFRFVSHATFHRSPPPHDPHGAGRYAVPFPLPDLLMRGLLARWNCFSPVKAPKELPDFCAHRMLVSSHRLEADHLQVNGKGETIGFRGRVRYRLYQCDPYWTGLIHLLADYAFYAGVGGRTATGLGQCAAFRPESGEELRSGRNRRP
ncbi:MAG: CRISPR system precrRNA processing endoribonuclease RAMP protein Cas6 [Chloroflexia bacterium]|nr:CRISPR system precrRNA processing endoribonuclease RAMP protein Cas6 [Chloroflexia bacterium]